MIESELPKQVRSFVSFALATKPSIVLQRHCKNEPLADTALEVRLHGKKALSHSEVSSLESLIKRYEPIKKYLYISDSPEDQAGFKISTCCPIVEFKPGVEYHIVKLDAEQLNIAKEVAHHVDRTYALHAAGDRGDARKSYDTLQDYLNRQREKLIGDFRNVQQFTEVIGMHGVGQNGNPRADGDCGGAVIFVIIEIFVCFQAEPEARAV